MVVEFSPRFVNTIERLIYGVMMKYYTHIACLMSTSGVAQEMSKGFCRNLGFVIAHSLTMCISLDL